MELGQESSHQLENYEKAFDRPAGRQQIAAFGNIRTRYDAFKINSVVFYATIVMLVGFDMFSLAASVKSYTSIWFYK